MDGKPNTLFLDNKQSLYKHNTNNNTNKKPTSHITKKNYLTDYQKQSYITH